MTRIKVLGLALVAVFAITAISASVASAGPIWYSCGKAPKNEAKEYTGHYASKTCKKSEFTEKGGKYMLVAGVGKGKIGKSKGGAAVLHSINPEAKVDIPVECAKFKGTFEVAPPNIIHNAVTTFSKCKALEAPCENVKKETIATEKLAGTIGWVEGTGKTVAGTDLASEAEPGAGSVAAFTCAALGEIRTKGSVIGVNAGNTNVVEKSSTLTFTPGPYIGEQEAEEGKLKWTPIVNIPKLEGGPVDLLLTEVKGAITGHPTEFYPPGGIPSGQEGTVEQKGEALGIEEAGSE